MTSDYYPVAVPDADAIKALEQAFTTIINTFGPWQTVALAAIFLGALFLWRWYNDRRKDKEVNQALEAMERAVQRAANEAREWKIVHLKTQCGWTDAQIQKFIVQNSFDTPADTRRTLEEKPEKDAAKRTEGPGGKKGAKK